MAKYNKRLVEKIVFLIEQDLYTVTEICNIIKVNRKTFYEWKNTIPEFRREVEEAMERRDDMLLSLARISLKQKIEGYTLEEEKITYEPAPANKGELREKSRVVKRKQYPPDIRAIKYVIERNDKKKQKEEEPQYQPMVINVPDQHTADQLRILERRLRGKDELFSPTPPIDTARLSRQIKA